MNITEREKQILFTIIEEYSETASPIGSVTLAKLFDVSSATIRAEMNKLEELGLLTQPHTSAGRVPTDAGYRLYVNSLMAKPETEQTDFSENEDFFEDKTDIKTRPDTFHNDTFGSIKNGPRTIYDYEREFQPNHLLGSGKNSRALEIRIMSHASADAAIKSAVDILVDMTGNLGLGTIGNQLYLSGISRLFAQPEFMDNSRIQSVAKLLDQLEPWLREAKPGEPLNIYIGAENPIGKNSGVSLIISKFRSPYSDRSYIGVLGPTRQNYARVMSLVKQAGNILETLVL